MSHERVVTDTDRCRLGSLLTSDDRRGLASRKVLDVLERELETADYVKPEFIPDDVVTMNSTVRLISVASGAEMVCTVVYPEDVELVEGGISVLSSLGSRLIGCEAGDLIECEDEKESGAWQIAEIVFQPERVGAFHL